MLGEAHGRPSQTGKSGLKQQEAAQPVSQSEEQAEPRPPADAAGQATNVGGPFVSLLGPLQATLRARPGDVLAAAMLLHAFLAATGSDGEVPTRPSGHVLAWPTTATFLWSLMRPAGVAVLEPAAKEMANQLRHQIRGWMHRWRAADDNDQGVDNPAALRLPRVRELQHQLEQKDRQLQQQQALIARLQQQQQQHVSAAGGGGPALVGAARRKASKPRSTLEALLAPAAAAAAASSGGQRSGASGGQGEGEARRLRPRRLTHSQQMEWDGAPERGAAAYAAAGRKAQRAAPKVPLTELLLPSVPLPSWGVRRSRRGG